MEWTDTNNVRSSLETGPMKKMKSVLSLTSGAFEFHCCLEEHICGAYGKEVKPSRRQRIAAQCFE